MGAAGNLPDSEKSRRTSRETLNEKPIQGIKKIRSAQVRAPLLNLPCLCQWRSLSRVVFRGSYVQCSLGTFTLNLSCRRDIAWQVIGHFEFTTVPVLLVCPHKIQATKIKRTEVATNLSCVEFTSQKKYPDIQIVSRSTGTVPTLAGLPWPACMVPHARSPASRA